MKTKRMVILLVAIITVCGIEMVLSLKDSQATPIKIKTSIRGTLPDNFTPGAEFDLFDYNWGDYATDPFNKIIGGPSRPIVSWKQSGFAEENVIGAYLVLSTGAWGNLAGLPELFLNGESIGHFGDTRPGTRYSQDIFRIDPALVTVPVLNFSFKTPRTGGTGWNKWFELGTLNQSEVGAIISDSTAPVPEPATMLLFGTGLVGLVGYARKKKRV